MDNADNSTARDPVAIAVLKPADLNDENVAQTGDTCVDAVIDRKPVNISAEKSDIKPVEELSVFVKSEQAETPAVQQDNVGTVGNTRAEAPRQGSSVKLEDPLLPTKSSVKLEDPLLATKSDVKLEHPLLATKHTDGTQENAIDPKTETKVEPSMDDDDGEDLPDNFFDDFSNNDFMAGLDIVDDWIDDGDGDKGHLVNEGARDEREPRERPKPRQDSFQGEKRDRSARERPRYEGRDHVRRERHSRERYLPGRQRDQDRYQRRSREREYERRSRNREHNNRAKEQARSRDREHAPKGPERGKRAEEASAEDAADSRRDPEKTKRDIQRDKLRCAKDHEIRVFQEQLKVAETGLVPPGTELDVVLESAKQKAIERRDAERQELQGADERRKSLGKYRRSGSRGRGRKSPEYRRKRREYGRYEKERSPSPRHRRRSRTPPKDDAYRRNDDLRLRIREKRRERYINELSPVSEARMSRSPSMGLSFVSTVSEREVWLRTRHRPRHGRSCSPISSSSLSDHGSPRRKRARKPSFIEEMQRTLADERTFPAGRSYGGHGAVAPAQAPPPPPPASQFRPPGDVGAPPFPPAFLPAMCPSPYATAPLMLGHPHAVPMGGGLVPPADVRLPQYQHVPAEQHAPLGARLAPAAPDKPTFRNDANLKACVSDSEALTKLFEEQKISLSDFLSVSAKPIDVQTINVHKKIQVISKCQEVVKAISDGARLCGRFFPTAMPASADKPADGPTKWKSPLRKLNPVRFMFTTPCKRTAQEDSSKVTLNKLLTVCGFSMLPDGVPRHLLPPKTPSRATSTPTSVGAAALPSPHRAPDPPLIVPQPAPPPVPVVVVVKCASTAVQTDTFRCQICEIRSARKFSTCGTQTTGPDAQDESTQVYQEDLRESCVTFTPRGILKNSASSVQSISHMTPAQLLALQQETAPPARTEAFPGARAAPLDRFSAPLRSPLDARPLPPFNEASYLSRTVSMPKASGFLSAGNSSPFASTFGSSSPDKAPFGGRPFGMSAASRNPATSSDAFQGGSWGAEGLGNTRSADRFSSDSSDRYSPEQTFKEAGAMSYMARAMKAVPGRGMPARGSYGMPNRPFYG